MMMKREATKNRRNRRMWLNKVFTKKDTMEKNKE